MGCWNDREWIEYLALTVHSLRMGNAPGSRQPFEPAARGREADPVPVGLKTLDRPESVEIRGFRHAV